MNDSRETVEVVYALPDRQVIVSIGLESGLTAGGAVERSGLKGQFPEIGERKLVLGIWGVSATLDTELRPGDRVEISRPLIADPRDMRRDLLIEGRVMGGARKDS